MIPDRLLLGGLVAVALFLASLHFIADDGMTRCQLTHSFDVCHDSIH
ncbi:hypothetical protein [Microcystis phage Mwe-Yong1]|nr:hypothetical protein [Microcystis phage Mwe-Yong1]